MPTSCSKKAPSTGNTGPSREHQVLCVSGKTEAAAMRAATDLARCLTSHAEMNLADAAYTLACGRTSHKYRLAVAADNAADAVTKLQVAVARQTATDKVVFLFSGQGTQCFGHGAGSL